MMSNKALPLMIGAGVLLFIASRKSGSGGRSTNGKTGETRVPVTNSPTTTDLTATSNEQPVNPILPTPGTVPGTLTAIA